MYKFIHLICTNYPVLSFSHKYKQLYYIALCVYYFIQHTMAFKIKKLRLDFKQKKLGETVEEL